MLYRYTPFATVRPKDPLFQYAVRRVRWGSTPQHLTRYTLLATGVMTLIAFALWGLVLAGELAGGGYQACVQSTTSRCYWIITSASLNFITLLMFGTIGTGIFVDFASIMAAANTLGGEGSTELRDLLRLTPILETDIVAAQHQIAGVRAWRMLAVIVGARVAVVLLLLIHTFILPLALNNPVNYFYGADPFDELAVMLALGLFFAIYAIEPLWRMSAVTALGLALVVRFRSALTAWMAAVGAIGVMWLVQGIIMAILLWASLWVTNWTRGYGVPFACAFVAFVIYRFYVGLRGWALGSAVYHSFRD
jgi:hypothetical protein